MADFKAIPAVGRIGNPCYCGTHKWGDTAVLSAASADMGVSHRIGNRASLLSFPSLRAEHDKRGERSVQSLATVLPKWGESAQHLTIMGE